MPSHTLNNPQRVSAVLRQARLASCLALALSLSTGVRSSVAGNLGADERASLTAMRASTLSQSALEPSEVFANIQAWRADHPRPQQLTTTVPSSTHVVTNCNNEGAGSLREVVGAAASGDTIDMSSLACDVIVLDSHLWIGQDNLTLRGSIVSGAPHPAIQPSDSGANTSGLLVHYGAGTLTVDSLWLHSGTRYDNGGCVSSEGSVTIASSMITDCVAEVSVGAVKGGGIYAVGMVILTDSAVSGNITRSNDGFSLGGGVYAKSEFRAKYSLISHNRATGSETNSEGGGVACHGNTIVLDSTVFGNHAAIVGGLYAWGTGNILIRSSTISDNSSIYRSALGLTTNGGSITITDITVTENFVSVFPTYEHAVGLWIGGSPSSVILSNSILVRNVDNPSVVDLEADAGIAVSGDHNVLGRHLGNMPTHIHQENAPLGPLADNGGPTPTHAIGTGSWAFNQGQTSKTEDQRGMPRPVGTGDDIGAFESDALFIGRFEEPPLG